MSRTATPPVRKHFHDIDGALSVLMFLSVALHAGTVYAPDRPWITGNLDRHPFFDWLIMALHLFITPTFFFVGGFFAVMLLSRRTVGEFIGNRLLRTTLPMIVIALTFNMVEHYLRWGDAGGAGSMLDWIASPAFVEVWVSGQWQLHLWFLVSLMPMFALAALVQAVIPKQARLRSWAVEWIDRSAQWIAGSFPFALGLIALALANSANFAIAAVVPGGYALLLPGFQSYNKLISEFPFFAIGVMAALSPRFLAALLAWRVWMPWAAALALLAEPSAEIEHGPVLGAAMLFLNQLAIWTLVLFVLQFFHRFFAAGGPRTTWLADSALSMYLIHHCLIYVFGQLLTLVDWPIGIEFGLLTIVAAGTVLAIHEVLVRRYAIFRLLFNGKTDLAAVRRSPGLIAAFFPGQAGRAKPARTAAAAEASGEVPVQAPLSGLSPS